MTDLTGTETKAPEKRWYVIHTYSGYENKVKANLEHRIESMGMEDRIFQELVPMEDEIEIRQGQRHNVQKKVYPGYVLVEMILDPDSWFVVRHTPGLTSFVGGANIPNASTRFQNFAAGHMISSPTSADQVSVNVVSGNSCSVAGGCWPGGFRMCSSAFTCATTFFAAPLNEMLPPV